MQIKNPSLLEKLQKTGFTDKEALVYTSLLELGGAYPSKIAEYSGIKRSTVYAILVTLSIRGLVNGIEKRNKQYYQIEKPEKIIQYAKNQINIAEEKLEKANNIIPDIDGLFAVFRNQPKVRYFEGIEGIVAIYSEQIAKNKPYEMLAISNTTELENVFPPKFFDNYRHSKEKIGITTRGIIPDTDVDKSFVPRLYKNFDKKIIPIVKYVPASKFHFKGEITLYENNKVSIVNLNKEYLTGLIIEDETIFNILKMVFELAWDSKLTRE